MSFVTWAALAISALVVAPFLAHMLRRRPPNERLFAASRFVPSQAAEARQRAAVEDRALLSVRAAAVCALAVLGATPLVRCSSLSLARPSGASVAMVIVLDDSGSMRAAPGRAVEPPSGDTRFAVARRAALELVGDLAEGDAAGIVLAGQPARVLLAPSRDFMALNSMLNRREATDRATDIDGALRLAEQLLESLPQVDKRVVLLSDRADATSSKALTVRAPSKLWVPLEDMAGDGYDCAVLQAAPREETVQVRVTCHGLRPDGQEARYVQLRRDEEIIARVPLNDRPGESSWSLPVMDARGKSTLVASRASLRVVLSGTDAIAQNDTGPVTAAAERARIGVVTDRADPLAPTGGAPLVEKALNALGQPIGVTPLTSVSDRDEDYAQLRGLLVDDTPGFTPSQRRALKRWVDGGGVLFLALGPRAAQAPIGAGFAPFVEGVIQWKKLGRKGGATSSGAAKSSPTIDASHGSIFGTVRDSPIALEARGRTELLLDDPKRYDVLARWTDGGPLVWGKTQGRGAVVALGLPLSMQHSALSLRPAFLSLLSHIVERARSRGAVGGSEVGTRWVFPGYRNVSVQYMATPTTDETMIVERQEDRGAVFVPELAGNYRVVLDGEATFRGATRPGREVALSPRPFKQGAPSESLGGTRRPVDASSQIALVLLALVAFEFALRVRGARFRRREVASSNEV